MVPVIHTSWHTSYDLLASYCLQEVPQLAAGMRFISWGLPAAFGPRLLVSSTECVLYSILVLDEACMYHTLDNGSPPTHACTDS